MRRPYTIEYYAALVDDIRARMPNASIGSDIIVGFPGETDDDFEQLVALSRALAADARSRVPVFRSAGHAGVGDGRQGRTAPSSASAGGASARSAARLTERFRASQVGTTHRALTLDDGTLAVTGNYLKVRIPPGQARNEWVRVRLTSQDDGELLRG